MTAAPTAASRQCASDRHGYPPLLKNVDYMIEQIPRLNIHQQRWIAVLLEDDRRADRSFQTMRFRSERLSTVAEKRRLHDRANPTTQYPSTTVDSRAARG